MSTHRTTLFALRLLLASLFLLSLAPRTAAAQDEEAVFFAPSCPHDGWRNVSRYRCSDSTMTYFHASEIESLKVTTKLKNGQTITEDLPPGTDAIFLSNIALQKFLVPYYQGVSDAKKVAALKAFMAKLVSESRARRATTPPRKK